MAMDHVGHALWAANNIYIRETNTTSNSTSTSSADTATRPPVYKAIGISLAIASGVFIGISFVFKKVGLLKANVKYNEEAGEGYGYLKNFYWWGGMTLMIIGEICNFVAYAFVDAILVTPMGALSVVITAILSAIFLKERLSMVGKIGCFLCIVGSVVIVMNAPAESSAANIQEMQHFVIAPGFLSYAGVIILVSLFVALWVAPRYGKKSMLVYISICSFIGGLSVVATQGLGAAIVAQIGGTPQFNQWFLYVLLVFVVATLVTEIIYLNKALNLFNAALVTPTYYVMFTSATIITSAILFQGFKGTVTSIITVVLGFFVICAGVVLLQLSKSAKDVPDTAVFSGDLDQVRTIAEQEQPESEPKADAIRGAGLGTIVRRFSVARQKMEEEELKRLHDEKQAELASINENGGEQYEWDGLRRRRTLAKSSIGSFRPISRPYSADPNAPEMPRLFSPGGTPRSATHAHPPLGMSHFPSYDDIPEDEENRPNTGNSGLHSSFFGSIRDRARSVMSVGSPTSQRFPRHDGEQSPMHPVALTEITHPYKSDYADRGPSEHVYGLPASLQHTAYEGAGDRGGAHIHFDETTLQHRPDTSQSSLAPEPPAHSARRQFSFHNVFRKSSSGIDEILPKKQAVPRKAIGGRAAAKQTKNATEEERLGLVKGDTNTSQSKFGGDGEMDEQYDTSPRDSNDSWDLADSKTIATAVPVPILERARGRAYSIEDERNSRSSRNLDAENEWPRIGREQASADGSKDNSSGEDEYAKRRMRWQSKGEPQAGRQSPANSRGGHAGPGAFI